MKNKNVSLLRILITTFFCTIDNKGRILIAGVIHQENLFFNVFHGWCMNDNTFTVLAYTLKHECDGKTEKSGDEDLPQFCIKQACNHIMQLITS